MTDSATPEPTGKDSAAVGFAMLMVGVEAAVASAAAEIAMLGQAVQQGFARLPAVSPPALPTVIARAPSAAGEALAPAIPQSARGPVAPAGSVPDATHVVRKAAEIPWQTPANPVAPMLTAPVAVARVTSDFAPPTPVSTAPTAPTIAVAPHLPATGAPDATGARSMSAPRVAAAAGWAPTPSAPTLPNPAIMSSVVATAPVSFSPAAPTSIHASVPHVQEPVSPSRRTEQVAALAPTPAVPTPPPTGAPAKAPAGAPGGEPAPSERAAQSQTGDILFDGTRVGQWMSDTLARAAGGPARGSTGFDPRMGARWPGALQGR